MSRRGYRCGGAIPKNRRQPLSIKGPFYCDFDGNYVDHEDMANPKYKPYVRFEIRDLNGKIGNFAYYIWDDARQRLFGVTSDNTRMPLPHVLKYLDILKEVFQKEIQIHVSKMGEFQKFAMPIVKKVFPKLIAAPLVSVQKMTAPLPLVFYIQQKYGANVGSIKNSV
jgi:hypothetical protein